MNKVQLLSLFRTKFTLRSNLFTFCTRNQNTPIDLDTNDQLGTNEQVDANEKVAIQKQKTSKKARNSKRMSLTPHQYYLTHGKGQERPFTGDLYFVNRQGDYHCVSCNHKLFSYAHKYFPDSGHCSFWGNHENSIRIVDDVDSSIKQYSHNVIKSEFKKGATDLTEQDLKDNAMIFSQHKQRAVCANCDSHLGLVYKDGPPPFFIRISANSESLLFKEKPINPNPLDLKRQKKQKWLSEKSREDFRRRQIDQKGKFNREKYYEVHEKQ